ncbi:MAG: SDR family oxidoreductase [Thermoleophilia bacterium]
MSAGPGDEARPLAGEVAVVTGTSRGLGREIALSLERAGATIGSLQRGEGVGVSLPVDLTDGEAAEAAVDELVARLGRVDVCVHAAGMVHREPALEVSLADWRRVLDLNLTAAFAVTRAAARHMVAAGTRGRIVHVASMQSFFGGQWVASYAASKGGVAQLTKAQSNEWAPLGIRVNAVAPGWVPTELTRGVLEDPVRGPEMVGRIPLGRVGAPEEIGAAVVWLASSASSYVTGAVLAVDGGFLAR